MHGGQSAPWHHTAGVGRCRAKNRLREMRKIKPKPGIRRSDRCPGPWSLPPQRRRWPRSPSGPTASCDGDPAPHRMPQTWARRRWDRRMARSWQRSRETSTRRGKFSPKKFSKHKEGKEKSEHITAATSASGLVELRAARAKRVSADAHPANDGDIDDCPVRIERSTLKGLNVNYSPPPPAHAYLSAQKKSSTKTFQKTAKKTKNQSDTKLGRSRK